MGRSYRSLVGKLNTRTDLQRNIKRAGCSNRIGRPVELKGNTGASRCCCKRYEWKVCGKTAGGVIWSTSKKACP